MRIHKVLSFLMLMCFLSVCLMLCGFTFFKKKENDVQVSSLKNNVVNSSVMRNNLWCVTFQLVWNDFMDKFTDGKPVMFVDGNPQIADELNKRLYTQDILSEKDYYKTQGVISHSLKKEIEKSIYKKFKEKSDILDMINWNQKDSYLFYAMLIKNFTFLKEFSKLDSDSFNGSAEKVKYFGIDKQSDKSLKENIDVLFYKSENEYAVKLLTKENEEVILFRTEDNDTLENLYNYVEKNTEFDSFGDKDVLKVPNIEVDKLISYDELCNKQIIGSDYIITNAIQTIKFKMDNKGGSLKSEAAIAVMKTALMPPMPKRYFLFDKPFVMFLKEQNKNKPYYMMKVEDTSYLVKD